MNGKTYYQLESIDYDAQLLYEEKFKESKVKYSKLTKRSLENIKKNHYTIQKICSSVADKAEETIESSNFVSTTLKVAGCLFGAVVLVVGGLFLSQNPVVFTLSDGQTLNLGNISLEKFCNVFGGTSTALGVSTMFAGVGTTEFVSKEIYKVARKGEANHLAKSHAAAESLNIENNISNEFN